MNKAKKITVFTIINLILNIGYNIIILRTDAYFNVQPITMITNILLVIILNLGLIFAINKNEDTKFKSIFIIGYILIYFMNMSLVIENYNLMTDFSAYELPENIDRLYVFSEIAIIIPLVFYLVLPYIANRNELRKYTIIPTILLLLFGLIRTCFIVYIEYYFTNHMLTILLFDHFVSFLLLVPINAVLFHKLLC